MKTWRTCNRCGKDRHIEKMMLNAGLYRYRPPLMILGPAEYHLGDLCESCSKVLRKALDSFMVKPPECLYCKGNEFCAIPNDSGHPTGDLLCNSCRGTLTEEMQNAQREKDEKA